MSRASGDVGAEQIRLIHRARSFLDGRQERGLDVALDPECYLNSWANVPGNARLRRLAFGWRAEPARLIAMAMDAASLFRSPGFAVSGQRSVRQEFDHLIVSWALPRDFDAHGAYTDRYLGLASCNTPRALWFLMLLTGAVPAELPPNVRVFHRSAPTPRLAERRWMCRPGSGRSSIVGAPVSSRRVSGILAQAQAAAAAVGEQLCDAHVRQIVMPYEAQPFQHAINLAAKARDPNIATVGYLHSAPSALPTDLMFRPGAPDRLLVHGIGQADILFQHLGWPVDRLKTIRSLRYLRDESTPFGGRILLPYAFDDTASILRTFEAYMRSAPPASMPRWEVRNHPVMAGSRRHIALAKNLRVIIERYANRLSLAESVSRQTLIVGATAAVIEALERGFGVVHICANPLFEEHSAVIWTHLDVQDLGHNAYRYRLREPGCYIRLGETRDAARENLGIDC